MTYMGTPILGDTLSGTSTKIINRQVLNAYKVFFIHPITNKKITIKANIPNDMKKIGFSI